MKKLWWLLPVALLAAGSLVFLGCPNGGGGGGGGGKPGVAFELTLEDNWQYGDGYQGTVPISELGISVNQFKEDQVWYFGYEFTASRDFGDTLMVGLVDPAQNTVNGETIYWYNLTKQAWDDEDEDMAYIGPDAAPFIAKDAVIGPDVLKFTVLRDALGTGGDHNKLVFTSKDTDGTKGTAGSGSKGPIKLTFTVFNFTDDENAALKPPEEPEEFDGVLFSSGTFATGVGLGYEKFTVGSGNEATVKLEGGNIVVGFSNGFNSWDNNVVGYNQFKLDFAKTDISGFSKITIEWEGLYPAATTIDYLQIQVQMLDAEGGTDRGGYTANNMVFQCVQSASPSSTGLAQADAQTYGMDWDDYTKKINGIEFVINSVNTAPNTPLEEADRKDWIVKTIKFEK